MSLRAWLVAAVMLVVVLGGCGVGPDEGDARQRVGVRRDGIVSGRVTWGFPQVFSILMEFSDGSAGTCSSTLVGRRTLLTAGHCISSEDKRAQANYVDATNATVRRGSPVIEALDSIPNPAYVRAAVDDESGVDVAMVKLKREPFVRPMSWNTQALDLSYRTQSVEATGYGVESYAATGGSGVKRTIRIPIQSVADRTLVTGTNVPLTGTCFGDSGGGIVYRFGDGVRRVIGVNSKLRGQACGPGTSARVDANDAWLRARFELYDAPVCGADNECVTVGCATPDPDCACLADGQCSAACMAPSIDADCANACAANGVCATVDCGASPDPDCAPVGSDCGRDAHCASRLCHESPQHPEPYCTQTCSASAPCPGTLECVSGECRWPVLPTAALGEACSSGTLCDGLDLICTAVSTQGADAKCRQRCLEPDDCADGFACAVDESGTKSCAPLVQLTALQVEELKGGCTSAPVLVWALAMLVLRRRR